MPITVFAIKTKRQLINTADKDFRSKETVRNTIKSRTIQRISINNTGITGAAIRNRTGTVRQGDIVLTSNPVYSIPF